jgi:hypothetical protein
MPSPDRRRRSERPSIAQQLAAVPVRNARVRATEDARGLTVTVDLLYPGLLKPLARALKMRKQRSYRLDGIGLAVYKRIDGKTTLETLVDWLADQQRLSFHEARTLLMQYLQTLMEKGLVVLAATGATPNAERRTSNPQ